MIRGLYKTDVVTITPEKTIKEAATLMRDRNVGDVVVVKSGNQNQQTSNAGLEPCGILTDRDIVISCVAEKVDRLDQVKVADVMSSNVTYVKEDSGLFDTIRRMREAGVGRILVVDDNRMLIGILTSQSIFDLLNDELHELGMIARSRRSSMPKDAREREGQSGETKLPPNLSKGRAETVRH